MIVTYTTRSGSVYEVRTIRGASTETLVRRVKLGPKYEKHPEKAAKRAKDGFDGKGRVIKEIVCAGVGDIMRIKFDRDGEDDVLYTNVVTQIEVLL